MVAMISSIYDANLGKNYELSKEFIERYTAEIDKIQSPNTPEGRDEFFRLLRKAAEEVTALK